MNIVRVVLLIIFELCWLCHSAEISTKNVISSKSKNDAIENNQLAELEYHKDHEITEKQARIFLNSISYEELKETPISCQAIQCTHEHISYCKSERLLKDHCCCEMSHSEDSLQFIPHTCYIPNPNNRFNEICQPFWDTCLESRSIRQCCCDNMLKKHWKSILSKATTNQCQIKHMLLAILLNFIVFIINQR